MWEVKCRILIADDESDIVSFIAEYFEAEGYETLTAYDGEEVIRQIGKKPDIILLDIMMPLMNGIEVCKTIREYVDCPIIFLTARIEEADIVEGLGAGADDYILKPFHINELKARVEVHLRRDKRKVQQSDKKLFGRLGIDFSQKKVCYEGNEISLTRKEYQIIEFLALNAGHVYSRERIYEKIWGYDADGDDSVIVEHIKRIRAKIAEYTDDIYLETVWGMGYKWKKC